MESFRVLGIPFYRGSLIEVCRKSRRGGLVLAPSGPGMSSDLLLCNEYKKALLYADINLLDSGLIALWCRFIRRKTIPRISGLRFLRAYLLETNWNREVSFWVMPTEAQSKANLDWVKSKFSHQVYEESVYIAPNYPRTGKIEDPRLLSILKSKNPDNVFIQIGGGVQERLGLYLKDNLRERTTVICTGAALAFLSGQQVKIPMWADRLFLGWFFRCLTKPRIFVPRYLKAFYLFYLLLRFDSNEPDFS